MFQKRLSEVTSAEIHAVIANEWAETDDFELKRELPAKSGNDVWYAGGKLGDYAKDALAAEIIAFANVSGGTLIVGIGEDANTKKAVPPIVPVRDCRKVAESLHQSIGARIEPRLPVFECEGVVTESDGSSGVVIMRTLQSYLGPHRHTQDRHCYVRRNDRAEPMGMLEIQELVLRNAKRLDEIDKALLCSADNFFEWLPEGIRRTHPGRGIQAFHQQGSGSSASWALRLTAKPTAPLFVSSPLHEAWIADLDHKTFHALNELGDLYCTDRHTVRTWVPRLRSIEREFLGRECWGVDRLGTDGQLDRYIRGSIPQETRGSSQSYYMPIQDFTWNAASILEMVDVVRSQKSRPAQPYALEIEFMASDKLVLLNYHSVNRSGPAIIPKGRVVFPRYEIEQRDQFKGLLNVIDRDVWNWGGCEPHWALDIQF